MENKDISLIREYFVDQSDRVTELERELARQGVLHLDENLEVIPFSSASNAIDNLHKSKNSIYPTWDK